MFHDANTCNERVIKSLQLNYKEQEVVDYGPMFVTSKYIGNNLQYQMLTELDQISKKKDYKYAIVTVHPNNIYSIRNLEKDNFKLLNTKEFERGIRNVYFKKTLNQSKVHK